jgi:hypothetical protein
MEDGGIMGSRVVKKSNKVFVQYLEMLVELAAKNPEGLRSLLEEGRKLVRKHRGKRTQ